VTSAVTSASAAAANDDDDEEEYEYIDPESDVEIKQRPAAAAAATTTTTNSAADAYNADADADDLIYEACDELVTTSHDPMTAVGHDYANIYYGRWDSVVDDGQELAFRRGDMVTVVSRQFDEFGWWVGALNGRVGLVPRNYLTPAYQLVNA